MKIDVVGYMCTWTKELSSSYIINDEILFDTPEGSFKSLLNDYNLKKIKLIVISHFHSDHFIDLHLVLTNIFHETKNNITIIAPKGCRERIIEVLRIIDASHIIEPLKERVTFIDCENNKIVNIFDYKIKIFKMHHHNYDAYGFIFQKDDKKIGFSGDTAMCNNLLKILNKSQVAFIDCAGIKETNNHLCVNEIVSLIKEYPNCKIYPIHLSYFSQKELDSFKIKYPYQGEIIEV